MSNNTVLQPAHRVILKDVTTKNQFVAWSPHQEPTLLYFDTSTNTVNLFNFKTNCSSNVKCDDADLTQLKGLAWSRKYVALIFAKSVGFYIQTSANDVHTLSKINETTFPGLMLSLRNNSFMFSDCGRFLLCKEDTDPYYYPDYNLMLIHVESGYFQIYQHITQGQIRGDYLFYIQAKDGTDGGDTEDSFGRFLKDFVIVNLEGFSTDKFKSPNNISAQEICRTLQSCDAFVVHPIHNEVYLLTTQEEMGHIFCGFSIMKMKFEIKIDEPTQHIKANVKSLKYLQDNEARFWVSSSLGGLVCSPCGRYICAVSDPDSKVIWKYDLTTQENYYFSFKDNSTLQFATPISLEPRHFRVCYCSDQSNDNSHDNSLIVANLYCDHERHVEEMENPLKQYLSDDVIGLIVCMVDCQLLKPSSVCGKRKPSINN